MSSLAQLLAIFGLLAASAFFAATEAAFLAMNAVQMQRLRDEGSISARILLYLRGRRSWILSTLLVGITATHYLAEELATEVSLVHIGKATGPTIAFVTMTLIILVFCEITPLRYGAKYARFHSGISAIPLAICSLLMAPVVAILSGLSRGLIYVITLGEQPPPEVTEDDLKSMIDRSEREGTLPPGYRRMLQGVLDFDEQVAAEIMEPRPDIVGIEADATVNEALQLGLEHKYSRLPAYEETLDSVVGIVYMKDLLPYVRRCELDAPVGEIARTALFAPENISAPDLLHRMQANQRTMAILTGEYGGTAGLVTVEDLLESIVGEIRDEHDVEEAPIRSVGENELVCDADISLRLLQNMVDYDLPVDEYNTLGAMMLDSVGHIPRRGQRARVGGVELVVEETDGLRVEKIRVIEVAPDTPEQQADGDV